MVFDPSKYKPVNYVPKSKRKKSGFDPSKYQPVNYVPKSQREAPHENQSLLSRIGSNIGRGAEEALYTLADIPAGFATAILNTGAALTNQPWVPEALRIPHRERLPMSSSGIPLEAGKLAGSLALALPTEGAALGALGRAGLSNPLAARALAGAAGGAVGAPAVDASPVEGALLGGVGAGAVEGLGQAAGRFLGRNVTPEEFETARAAIPEGIKAPIGELAESPRAKKAFGLSRGIAFSGADRPYNELYNYLNRGTAKLTEDAPLVGNPNQFVYDDMKNAYETAKQQTRNAYDNLAQYADTNSVPFSKESFADKLNEDLNYVNSKIKNKTSMDVYGPAKDALEDFLNTPINTFEDATTIRPALNSAIEKAARGDNRVTVNYLQKIKSALDDAIKQSSEIDPNLLQLHNQANDARIYQGTFEKLNRRDKSPFYKTYLKDGDPGAMIGSYIKTSNKGNDYAGLLSHLTDKISPEAKDVLAKAHLDPQDGASLSRQLTKLSRLSPRQRQLLFDDKAGLAEQLNTLSTTFPGAKGADFTPLTGFTGSKPLQMLGEGAGLGAFSATHKPSTLLAALGFPIAGQTTQRVLRSEALKNLYSRYLRNQQGPLTSPGALGALARSITLDATGGN